MADIIRPWLSEVEVEELTKKVRPQAQIKQLRSLGMFDSVRIRTDGSFVVLRDITPKNIKPSYQLNLGNLGRGT